MATGNSIIPLLSHVLEENFFLLYVFSSVTVFSTSPFTPMILCINSLKAPYSAIWSLPSVFPSSFYPYHSLIIFWMAPLILLLHVFDYPPLSYPFSMFPTTSAASPLHISCWGSPSCLPNTSLTSAHLALHPLHTRFSSDTSGRITYFMV